MTRHQHARARAAIAKIVSAADDLDRLLEQLENDPLNAIVARTSVAIRQMPWPLTEAILKDEQNNAERFGRMPASEPTNGDKGASK